MSISKIINFKENVPQNVKNALSKIGNNKITNARVGRTPVQAVIQGALKVVANVPYDDLFHLFIELTLDNGQKWILEKIERINLVKEDRSKKQGQVQSYAKGGVIKRTGLIRAHKGEIVINAKTAKALKGLMKR